MDWIFLDKNHSDQYMQMLARGCGAYTTNTRGWQYEHSQSPLVLRGIMKHKFIKQCWQDKRWFWYMDSGYMGNRVNSLNPGGWKRWHRIVPNNLQHGQIIPRPGDRFDRLQIKITAKRRGRDILLLVPDEKPCVFYGLDRDVWLQDTIATIKRYTDRPIVLRERTASRTARKVNDLAAPQNVHCVVTFNSVAATEAVLSGTAAYVLAPCNAAIPVANTDLSNIDEPWLPQPDQVRAWANHLAYGQFHITELEDGTAYRILRETKEMLDV